MTGIKLGYIYVKDVAEAIVNFGLDEKSDKNTFNAANQLTHTVKELIRKIWEIGGVTRQLRFKNLPLFKADARRRVPDVTKAMTLFDWKEDWIRSFARGPFYG